MRESKGFHIIIQKTGEGSSVSNISDEEGQSTRKKKEKVNLTEK
jgi:hypothetical protein